MLDLRRRSPGDARLQDRGRRPWNQEVPRSRPGGDGGATDASTTALGDWYATALSWRPQVALFVNEATLLPVLMPLAPAGTVMGRFPEAVATVLRAHGVSGSFVDRELAYMAEHRLAGTKSRSVIGIMNEFGHLGSAWRVLTGFDDLVALSMRLARTPCGPLYGQASSAADYESVPEGMRTDGLGDPGPSGQAAHDPPGGMPVNTPPGAIEEDRSLRALADGQIDGPSSSPLNAAIGPCPSWSRGTSGSR